MTTPDLPAVAGPVEALTAPPFTDFYRTSRDEVARALALTLGDVHLAADAADEGMARAYVQWKKVGDYDNPAGWVYRVGLNWATSFMRRHRRRDTEVFRDIPDVGPIAEPSVRAALADLDMRHRAVVVCRYYLQMSEAEIAQALGTAPGTVKSRLHRAMRTLESRLAHLNPSEDR